MNMNDIILCLYTVHVLYMNAMYVNRSSEGDNNRVDCVS